MAEEQSHGGWWKQRCVPCWVAAAVAASPAPSAGFLLIISDMPHRNCMQFLRSTIVVGALLLLWNYQTNLLKINSSDARCACAAACLRNNDRNKLTVTYCGDGSNKTVNKGAASIEMGWSANVFLFHVIRIFVSKNTFKFIYSLLARSPYSGYNMDSNRYTEQTGNRLRI